MMLAYVVAVVGLVILFLLSGVFAVIFSGEHGGFREQGDWLGQGLLIFMQSACLGSLTGAIGLVLWLFGFR